MNEELDFIKKEGWILSESGLKTIDLNGTAKKNITKLLLDRDLREIGAGIGDLHKGKFENIEHESVVLQILKSRNISAPKSNETSKTAPKLLKLQLTDGQNTYSAIEMEPTALSLETRPGTKISLKVKLLKYANGQLLLTPKNMEILGGYVESLVSKWEISRSLATQMKGNRSGAAPPFIPFGQKIQQNLPNDRGFKSLQQSKQKEAEENSEFNAQRQDAIAEATKAGTRKTFGGGNKTLVDSNVQKIMDKGYSEEQATVALKYAKNNVERALGNLKRRDERQQQRAGSHDYNNTRGESSRDYNSKRVGGKGGSSEPPQAKPSTGVSLFDFLEDKIPEKPSTNISSSTAKQSSYTHNSTQKYEKYDHNERFENNISSSFRKHDKENSNKSQQWSQYSSSSEQKSSQNYQKNSYNARNSDYRNNNINHESTSREHSTRDYNRKYERDSRDYRDGQRDARDSRDSKYHQSSNYSSKPNTAPSGNSVYSKPSHAINQKPSSSSSSNAAAPNHSSNAANNSGSSHNSYNNKYENNHPASNKGKYGQKPDYHNGSNRSSSGANNSNYNSKYDKPPRPNQINNNSSSMSSHHHQQSSHSNEMYQKPRERNLVESMEKMNIKQQPYKSYETSYESKSSSYPPLSSSSNESKPNFSKPQSNYSIVGFQNKEANEQAKNALKTKNIPGNVQAPPPQPKLWQPAQQPAPQQVPIAVPVISQQPLTKGPPPPFPSNSVPQAAPQAQPPTIHTIQPAQSYVQHQVMHAMPQPAAVLTTSNPPPGVFHATPITYNTTQIIMQSVQPPQIQQVPPPQQLKVGDFCLAKYWEDGKFYNAKITGISESTYVVLFTDYGNAEEVRKNDCLPLISVPTCPTPPQPITNFVPQPQQMGSYRISSQQKMPQQHNYHSQQGMPYKGAGKNPRRN